MKIKENGITLIALVITVIILLILAAVAVSAITGKDGLFSQANNAGTLYNEKAKEEYDTLQELLNSPYFTDEELENMDINETIEIATFSFEDNKLAENKSINIVANASGTIDGKNTPGITKVELKIGDELVYVDNVMATKNYNKTINLNNLNNLEKLNFYDDYTATLIVTTVGKTQESATCDNVKNYTIGSVDSLKAFERLVNSGTNFSGESIFQLTDIDLNNIAWTPIGKDYTEFSGSYNGNNKTISGLNVNSSTYDAGFFGYALGISATEPARISNLTVEGSVKGTYDVGGIIGRINYATIDNCINKATISSTSYSSDSSHIGSLSSTGGIVGRMGTLAPNIVSNCKNYGVLSAKNDGIGGIAGWCRIGTITNCENFTDISCSVRSIGGIIGAGPALSESSYLIQINKSRNFGTIAGKAAVGGIAGNASFCNISQCSNTKNITSTTSYNSSNDDNNFSMAGGIAGNLSGSITYSYNTGNVTSAIRGCAGIVGRIPAVPTNINYCYNTGNITNNSSNLNGRTAGIAGRVSSSSTLQITSCWKLENCIKKGVDNDLAGGDEKTADEIKALTWDNFTVDPNLNNGFPVLTWETENNNNNN